MRNKLLAAALTVLCVICAQSNQAAVGKRTILTAGEKVHPIRFRLGQSTILYLGFKPETVICGNTNYFNIQKIKEGVTIQPLANFATNLSILDKDKRYLFYLAPAMGLDADSFVDVRWVAESEMLPVEHLETAKVTKVREINQRVRISREIELVVLRQKGAQESPRRIFELELRNLGRSKFKTASLALIAMSGRRAIGGQVLVWEKDEVDTQSKTLGRLVLPRPSPTTAFDLVARYQGKDIVSRILGALR